jgi:hypothetical protein
LPRRINIAQRSATISRWRIPVANPITPRIDTAPAQGGENVRDLLRGEDLDLGASDPRRLGRRNRVAGDDGPFDCMAEDAMQEPMNVADGARRESGAGGTLQLAVQLGEVGRSQLLDRGGAKVRSDMVAQQLAIAFKRLG